MTDMAAHKREMTPAFTTGDSEPLRMESGLDM